MDEQYLTGINKWIALMVVVLGTFMAVLDSSIVNIAIPKMMAVTTSLSSVKSFFEIMESGAMVSPSQDARPVTAMESTPL